MGAKPGVIMALTTPVEADMIDRIAADWEITTDEARQACVSAMAGMLFNPADPGHERARKFMRMVADASHRAIDTALLVAARKAG